MTTLKSTLGAFPFKSALVTGAAISLTALTLAGCSNGFEPLEHTAGFSTMQPAQLHPIVVSQEPADMSVRVARGSDGLDPHQRANVAHFLGRYRGSDSGNAQLSIKVPSGSSNEVAALRAVSDIREIVRSYGIDDSRVSVAPYHADRGNQPSIRISYNRFVAEAPECGIWTANLADDSRNVPSPNFGCSTQRNFALQVANPADLLGPRTMTPAIAESRDVKWEKFLRGESVISKKDADEKATIKSDK